jgi:hypothetical protein
MIGYLLGRNLELVDRVISSFGWLMLGVLRRFPGLPVVAPPSPRLEDRVG